MGFCVFSNFGHFSTSRSYYKRKKIQHTRLVGGGRGYSQNCESLLGQFALVAEFYIVVSVFELVLEHFKLLLLLLLLLLLSLLLLLLLLLLLSLLLYYYYYYYSYYYYYFMLYFKVELSLKQRTKTSFDSFGSEVILRDWVL